MKRVDRTTELCEASESGGAVCGPHNLVVVVVHHLHHLHRQPVGADPTVHKATFVCVRVCSLCAIQKKKYRGGQQVNTYPPGPTVDWDTPQSTVLELVQN